MKALCIPTLVLLLHGWQALAQDSIPLSDAPFKDTTGEHLFVRHFQLEPSLFVYPENSHIGIGVNFPARKHGWRNTISLMYNRSGYYEDGLIGLSVGKKYAYTPGKFYISGGLNTGFFWAMEDGEGGLLLTPELNLGIRVEDDLTICIGGFFGVGAIWDRIPKSGSWLHQVNIFGWFEYAAVYSPYLKLVFDLRSYPKGVKPEISPVPKPVNIRESLVNELDSTRRQLAIAGFGLENTTNGLYCGILETNFPTKKRGRYNSIIAAAGTFSSMSGYFDSRNEYYLLGVGKKYELIRNHVYYAAGISVGPCYNYVHTNEYKKNTYGLSLVPHIEAGVSVKRIVVAAGLFIPVGGGYFERNYFGDGPSPYSGSGIDAFINASPYLKIMLK